MRKMRSSIDSSDVVLSSRSETESLGEAIGRAAKGGEVLALIGELGAGKTALVKGVAAGLGAPRTSVSSPTFVLVHEYQGRLPLIHIDLYRLRNSAEAEGIGLQDYFSGHPVVAVEWADRFPALLPQDRLEIRLTHRSPVTRTARLRAQGPLSLRLLSAIKRVWQPSRQLRATNRSKHRKTPTR